MAGRKRLLSLEEFRNRFFAEFRKHGNSNLAAKAAGVSIWAVQRARNEVDDFRREFEEVLSQAHQAEQTTLETTLLELATGFVAPVYDEESYDYGIPETYDENDPETWDDLNRGTPKPRLKGFKYVLPNMKAIELRLKRLDDQYKDKPATAAPPPAPSFNTPEEIARGFRLFAESQGFQVDETAIKTSMERIIAQLQPSAESDAVS